MITMRCYSNSGSGNTITDTGQLLARLAYFRFVVSSNRHHDRLSDAAPFVPLAV